MGRKKVRSSGRKLTAEQRREITEGLLARWEQQGIDQFLQPPSPEPKRRRRALARDGIGAARRPAGVAAVPAELSPGRRGEGEGQPGLAPLLDFFRAVGVSAEVGHAGCLAVNGIRTEPLTQIPPPGTSEWINLVNEIALKCVRDEFIRAVEDNARFGDDLHLSLQPRERGFVIMRGDTRVGVIHPAHAFVQHRPFIYANFLTSGSHWRQVADVIHHTKTKRQQRTKPGEAAVSTVKAGRRHAERRRRLEKLPGDLVPALAGACLDASRRIRLERQVAYARPVILECAVGELTLLPITNSQNRLLMPFRFTRGSEIIEGELVLGDRDPLPLLIGEHVTDKDAVAAWTYALLGFAAATCVTLGPTAPRDARRQMRPPSSTSSRHAPRTLPQTQVWPRHLEPVGLWIRYSSSFVAGHRRRLSDGRTATDEARTRARQVGITLHPHQTWVSAHARGIPDGTEIRFRWHTPIELSSPVYTSKPKSSFR